ncbi:MAG: nitronate monooxygenase, partial [Marmoricola sp.]
MDEFITRIGIRFPILQAGMGGGIAGADLAAAVTAAGGLGTLGMGSPSGMHRQLVLARERATGPIGVNLLLPFVRRGHASVAAAADVVVTFWGKPERRSDKPWI